MKYAISANQVKNSEGSVRGFASIVFGDSFKITNIAILENAEKGSLFVSMPRYKSNERDEDNAVVYKDVCNPINAVLRKDITERIIKEYNNSEVQEPEIEVNKPNVSVKVVPYSREGSTIKGYAKIYIDDSFVINNVSIHQRKNGLGVSMPSYKTKQVGDDGKPVYQEYCYPITKEFREYLHSMVLEGLETAREQNERNFEENCNRISEKDDIPEPVLNEENLPSFLK